jgi:hypothetical protein
LKNSDREPISREVSLGRNGSYQERGGGDHSVAGRGSDSIVGGLLTINKGGGISLKAK